MAPHNGRPIDAPRADDAFGEMVWDYYHDQVAEQPVYRRDDGEVTVAHLDAYFTAPTAWPRHLRETLAALDGPVLDIGCGPGKHARYLQAQDTPVFAIDRSPGAIAVARESGVDHAAVMDMDDVAILDETFRSVVVLGKQIAVGDGLDALSDRMATLARVVEPGGRLLADFDAPERRGDDYLDGRWLGDGAATRRFRLEYDDLVGPWVDVLLLDRATLDTVVTATPWEPVDVVADPDDGSSYLVAFERA